MKSVNINIRIPVKQKEEFYKAASSNSQVPSALIRIWIDKYIKENDKYRRRK